MNGMSLPHSLSSHEYWSLCVCVFIQNDVRVKFEYKGEKRILQFFRPVRLDDLGNKAKVAFGQVMDLHYTNNEVHITITSSPSHSGAGRYTVFYNRPVLMPRLVLVLTWPCDMPCVTSIVIVYVATWVISLRAAFHADLAPVTEGAHLLFLNHETLACVLAFVFVWFIIII